MAEAGANTIDLQIKPGLDKVRPLVNPARLTLTLLDSTGKAMVRPRFQIRLYAPPRSWLFSTDFPQVESTPLLDIELPAVNGKVDWEYLFPIRGDYRLEVGSVDSVGNTVKRVFSLPIRESRTKLFYLGTILTGLFLFGVMVGRLFTLRGSESGIAGGILLLVGSVLNICPVTAQEQTTKVSGDKEFVVPTECQSAHCGRVESNSMAAIGNEDRTALPNSPHPGNHTVGKGEKDIHLERNPN